MLPISMGNSNFKEIRERGSYYIDKSMMIQELLADQAKVVLLPRPRRFGKTLNLNMCEAFFSDHEPNRHLFDGLAISADKQAMSHYGRYPTIFLTLKDVQADSWEGCQIKLKDSMSTLFQDFESRIKPRPAQKTMVDAFIFEQAPIEKVEKALGLLTRLLYEESGMKVMVLIDEYDAPIQQGYAHGYYDKIVGFMRSFLGFAFKDNKFLQQGVLTGVLRVAQESIFSGLNNIQVYTVLDNPYASCFGFDEDEVHKILVDSQRSDQEKEIKHWYNGYRIGSYLLYNPWSILSLVKSAERDLNSYWINTSQDFLIEKLITEEHCVTLQDLTTLLKGETVEQDVYPSVPLNRIDGQSIWSLLLFSGYLTFEEKLSQTRYRLKLPNREVRHYFEQIVRRWIESPQLGSNPLSVLLEEANLEGFKAYVQERVLKMVGSQDTGGKSTPENFYHGLMLGLVAHELEQIYEIRSNREAGYGRYDLQLCPRQPGLPGYLFEFKSLQKADEQSLQKGAGLALEQIHNKGYATELQDRGVHPLWCVGIAFHSKKVAMKWCEAHELGTQQDPGPGPSQAVSPEIVISYSHKDENYLRELEAHLKPLMRHHSAVAWSDKSFEPGTHWQEDAQAVLDHAKIALLLVSSDYLASDHLATEMQDLIEAARNQGLQVLWCLVRPCFWMQENLAHYPTIYSPDAALSSLSLTERETVLSRIVEELYKLLSAPING